MKQALLSLFVFAASVTLTIRLGFAENELDTGSVYLFPVKDSFSGKSFCVCSWTRKRLIWLVPPLWWKCLNLETFRRVQGVWFICVFFIVVCNSWDTELNTSSTSLGSSHFPCGACESSVGWNDRALVCDSCNVWYHIDCQGMDSTM